MYQYKGMEDTIAAIATPAGQGAIGVVRISGKDAFFQADSILRLAGSRRLADCASHTVHHGWVIDHSSGETIDEVLTILMRGPKSYTAEDVVEISCHGGPTVLRAVLAAVLKAGARPAMPGEFTKRAFLNGRMDLAQAEAVIDIIQARTRNFLRQSHHQLTGELSTRLNEIREGLTGIYTILEALINFPEEGVETQSRRQIRENLEARMIELDSLLETSESGRMLKEGVRIVLCGKPNVGKSSLLNAILRQQRAIVTDIPGTTRDVLEESAQIKGVAISLVDTAGILEPRDLIEQEAVKRSQLYIKSADLVVLVLDHSRPLEEQDRQLLEQLKAARVLVAVNKSDLEAKLDPALAVEIFGREHVINVSAFQPDSIRRLEAAVEGAIFKDKNLDTHGVLVSNLRHVKALESARENLQDARRLMDQAAPLEVTSEQIKSAINQLDAITGRNIDEDLIDRIFSEFCIGK